MVVFPLAFFMVVFAGEFTAKCVLLEAHPALESNHARNELGSQQDQKHFAAEQLDGTIGLRNRYWQSITDPCATTNIANLYETNYCTGSMATNGDLWL
mmetsp:Transcript_26050/g.71444  ORF Transcript_26050/g.71444 Transcript_26050/m.71444 type:complete len:98 (-) Transcript_26050:97-390(-)